MSIIRTAIIAASFVVVAAAANAQGREDLNSGIHGNASATVMSGSSISAEARGAFARAGGSGHSGCTMRTRWLTISTVIKAVEDCQRTLGFAYASPKLV